MKEFKGIVKNITHSIVMGSITYTTPVYDVEYTCKFSSNGTFFRLICDKHNGVVTIPHKGTGNIMCIGKDFRGIINQAYPDKELIHLVCKRFFRQYNESDSWGTPAVLKMCGFVVHRLSIYKSNFKQLLSEYDYYSFNYNNIILKLTHDCKDKLTGRCLYFIKRDVQ